MVNVAVPCQLLLSVLLEDSEDRKQVAPSLPQGALRQVSEVRCKALESGYKHSVELAEISQAILWVEVISPPALFELDVVPPPVELGLGGQGRHFVKGLVDQPDVSGINDRLSKTVVSMSIMSASMTAARLRCSKTRLH